MRCAKDTQLEGAVNCVGPSPVTNRTFTDILAKTLGRPAFFPVPAFGLRLAYGTMADETVLASQRVQPKVLTALGYKFSDQTSKCWHHSSVNSSSTASMQASIPAKTGQYWSHHVSGLIRLCESGQCVSHRVPSLHVLLPCARLLRRPFVISDGGSTPGACCPKTRAAMTGRNTNEPHWFACVKTSLHHRLNLRQDGHLHAFHRKTRRFLAAPNSGKSPRPMY